MNDNPIVDEVHRIRREMLAEHGGDLDALVKELQRRMEESVAAGRQVVTMPPRPALRPTPSKKAS